MDACLKPLAGHGWQASSLWLPVSRPLKTIDIAHRTKRCRMRSFPTRRPTRPDCIRHQGLASTLRRTVPEWLR